MPLWSTRHHKTGWVHPSAALSSPLNKGFPLGCLCGPCCWLFK
ncbi:hypothetical protein [Holospora undulata]|nr:hypothetical protein [Holospora undulata]